MSTHSDSRRPSIDIRPMVLEDLAPVYALGEQLFTAERWPVLYRTWDQYELIEFFAADEDTCLVAEVDGKLVGFLLGTLIEKPRSAWSYGWVVWLGIDPDRARSGIGGKLLEKVTEQFREQGARILIADTAANNEAALGFFRGNGFDQAEKHVFLAKNLEKDGPRRRARSTSRRTATSASKATHKRRRTR